MNDKEIDITVDQLIADLCMIRGKTPEFGTMKLYNVSIECGLFSFSATDGNKIYTMTIEPECKQIFRCKDCQFDEYGCPHERRSTNCADWLKRE